jgi:ribose 5-phosphate isomerase B
MKIYLAADHRGFHLKQKIAAYLAKRNLTYEDVGDEVLNPDDDFPQFGQAAALQVIGSDDSDPRAILVCGGGQGMAIAANRFRGIRAVVISTSEEARLARHDNDANVLSLPADLLDNDDDRYWQDIVDTFLATEFAGAARYVRRNRELDELS